MIAAKVDLSSLHFQEDHDTLGVIVGLFDADGAYVAGTAETVNLTVAGKKDPVTLRWSFNVKPGVYAVRLVIREVESKAMTTMNRTMEVR